MSYSEQINDVMRKAISAWHRLEFLKQQYEKDTGNTLDIDYLNELQHGTQDHTMPNKQS